MGNRILLLPALQRPTQEFWLRHNLALRERLVFTPTSYSRSVLSVLCSTGRATWPSPSRRKHRSESAAFYPKTPVAGQAASPAEKRKSPLVRAFRLHLTASVLMNVPVLGFPEEDYSDHQRY